MLISEIDGRPVLKFNNNKCPEFICEVGQTLIKSYAPNMCCPIQACVENSVKCNETTQKPICHSPQELKRTTDKNGCETFVCGK
jgi:hypothetical protein